MNTDKTSVLKNRWTWGMMKAQDFEIGTPQYGHQDMKLFKAALILSMLPWLNGCITSSMFNDAKTHASTMGPDEVYHVEKAVISEDKLLVIYLEGCLTDSPQRIQFTLNVPLRDIESKSAIYHFSANPQGGYNDCGTLVVSRNAIHTGWRPKHVGGNLKEVAIGNPIPAPRYAPYDLNGGGYAAYAKLLPDTTQTLYVVTERQGNDSNNWPAELKFVYVNASSKQKYTVIRVKEAVVPDKSRLMVCYLASPFTIALDIATSPIQIIVFGTAALAMAGGHT